MRLHFWGTRGSLASPGPDRVRYGGNTLCVQVISGEREVILDAGTALPALSEALLARPEPPTEHHLLLSHFHWDHILGLPFFMPLYLEGHAVHLYGVDAAKVEETLYRLFHAKYSPIKGTENLVARLEYHTVPIEGLDVAGFRVTPRFLSHPTPAAPTLAYRVADGERTLVYATDHEAGRDELIDFGLTHLCKGADALIHDAAFTPATYPEHRGWGHSCWSEALKIATEARIERLVLFHYNPDHSDQDLDREVAACRAAAPEGLEVIASRDGMTLEL